MPTCHWGGAQPCFRGTCEDFHNVPSSKNEAVIWTGGGVTHGPSSPGTYMGHAIPSFKIRTVPAHQSLSFWVHGKGAPKQAGWGDIWGPIRPAGLLGPQVSSFLKNRHFLHDVWFYGVTSMGLALCCGLCQGSGKNMSLSQALKGTVNHPFCTEVHPEGM